MANPAGKMTSKAAAVLQPGETVVAACRALPPGGIKASAKRAAAAGVGGAVGAAIATKVSKPGEPAPTGPAALPVAAQMFLGVTDRQVIVMSQSALMGSPKQVLGTVPLSSLQSCTAAEGATLGMKNLVITLTFKDGSSQNFEIARLLMSQGQAFCDAVAARLGGV